MPLVDRSQGPHWPGQSRTSCGVHASLRSRAVAYVLMVLTVGLEILPVSSLRIMAVNAGRFGHVGQTEWSISQLPVGLHSCSSSDLPKELTHAEIDTSARVGYCHYQREESDSGWARRSSARSHDRTSSSSPVARMSV